MGVGRFESLIRPPADVPVTARDVAQTGITAAVPARRRPGPPVRGFPDQPDHRPRGTARARSVRSVPCGRGGPG
ncbi:hypothetical protein KSE_05000 [Kitasatospora setae KM-6054]|uniref:Uncharacterized protein n=1 Tax=Kitasatospora setae (strain ATCC 33774 / DSM 43861 / JCM 3304 / KCC A-0304 / NBRC 14216 / KM-6054) TaxID=452652 RepID=E4N565_KITSK|nr:hypothetical protein KSE_05000 [Kitasatospora setae KM-6054]